MRTNVVLKSAGPERELNNAFIVLAVGATGIGYFLLKVAFGTDFFFHNGLPAAFTPLQVWGTCGLIAAESLSLMWRRTRSIAVFLAVVVLMLTAVVLTSDRDTVVGPPLLFAVYNLTSRRPWQRWLCPVIVGASADLALQLVIVHHFHVQITIYVVVVRLIQTLVSYLFAIPVGLLVNVSQRRAQLAADYAAALEREQAALLAAAVVGERNRMARELHDATSHHLTGIVAQVRAAAFTRERNPAASQRALKVAEAEGALAMQGMHEMIAVLRSSPGSDDTESGPNLSGLPELIENVRSTNPRVELVVDGTIDDLSAATSLACYRIIQESLSNARKHSPGTRVNVAITRKPAEIIIEVRNDAPVHKADRIASKPGGFGLVGMRERAALLGGVFESGRTPDGGWRTRTSIPLGGRVPA